ALSSNDQITTTKLKENNGKAIPLNIFENADASDFVRKLITEPAPKTVTAKADNNRLSALLGTPHKTVSLKTSVTTKDVRNFNHLYSQIGTSFLKRFGGDEAK